MGQLVEYPITYSDGLTTNMGAYLPSTYVKGNPQKWVIVCHGGGQNWKTDYLAKPEYQQLAEEYNLVLVGADGQLHTTAWVDVNDGIHINKRLEESVSFIKAELDLYDYLPCITGLSMGGYKTLYEMVHFPEKYSAFACSNPLASMINPWGDAYVSWNALQERLFGGSYPNADEVVNNRYEWHSANEYINVADLKGRKLWLAVGKADATISYTKVYQPLINRLPISNKFKVYEIENGEHVDFVPDYGDEVFSFFANESIQVPLVQSVIIEPQDATIKPNETAQFTSTDQDGNDITGQVSWSTSDNTLATIDQNGLVTAIKVGSVNITAELDGLTSTANVEVIELQSFAPGVPVITGAFCLGGSSFGTRTLPQSERIREIIETQYEVIHLYSIKEKINTTFEVINEYSVKLPIETTYEVINEHSIKIPINTSYDILGTTTVPPDSKQLTFTGTLQPGDELVIDLKNMTAKLNGINVLDLVNGAFFALLAGTNEIKYEDEETQRTITIEVQKNTKFL